MRRTAIIGATIWCLLFIVSRASAVDLTWIGLLFLFAPLVIVPLGIFLTGRLETGAPRSPAERSAQALQLPAALLAAVSFFLEPGIFAAGLATPWLAVCILFAIGGAARLTRGALARLDLLFPALAFLYLAVGGTWLVASRLGLNFLGFQEPIVLLTAVHFHYAGFAAPLLTRCVGRSIGESTTGNWASVLFRVVAAGILAGPCILAMGFVWGPRLKLAAALLLTASEVGLAIAFVFALNRVASFVTQLLLTVAAASVAFSMGLAAVWAIGEFPLQQFVNLDRMERFHGTANAFGFTLCGLLGWILGSKQQASDKEPA